MHTLHVGIESAHLGSGHRSLDALLERDLFSSVGVLGDRVAADSPASGVVDDDVAALSDGVVDPSIDLRITGRLTIGPPGGDRRHAGSRLPAPNYVVGDLLGLRR